MLEIVVHQRGFEPPRRKARAPQARVSTIPPLMLFIEWNYTTLSLFKL